ncbi:sec-independent protein translocase protein TatB [Nitrosomonas sp. Nm84]|uniref:Sec-independent protein translocase protein TatB n=1 Tax=Nitrosomonas sp. Nm84 TaxID=200124 RepID=UPI000D75FDCD|nr:Sec-independent protein translocase protein TatB [Nitrosomonas sp. Nm84]PXW91192.1 sec-independent protein translocase protein TatB [Nitrosomonas sp. Nm84]
MFDISFMEILVISIVALIVIGPERLPTVARTLGHLYGRCRGFVYSVKTDIHNEMRMEELKKMQSSVQDTVQSVENSIRQSVDQLETTVTDAKNNVNPSANLLTPQSHTESHQPSGVGESLHDAPNQEKK